MSRAFATVVLFAVTAISSGLTPSALAQIKTFPYEAKVVADETFARSGAGDAYYPTQSLSGDTVVTVHRHDPGGWYMIDPPEGSFSWIPERFVKRLSDSEGEVREENVPAWVGSAFGDETSVFQRRMKSGEKIMILGQKQIDTSSGVQSMLKIAPPARERRWIPGSAVVPVDDQLRQQMNADPYKVPGNAKRPPGPIVTPRQSLDPQLTQKGEGGVVDVPQIGPSEQLAGLQQIRHEQQQLAALDSKFRSMILQDASQWNLDAIERDYRALQDTATHRPVAGQIDLRYPAIERYRRRLANLIELKQLTSQTEMRDAQLLARHSSPMGFQPSVVASAGPESMMASGEPTQIADAFESFLSRDTDNIAANDATFPMPVPESSQPAAAENPELTSAGVITPGSNQNRFVGAGIVQKATEGNAYVLMAPSGKILADLKPTGNVSLEEFVGQQVGVQGSRWSEKEKRDIIEVSALEAVRIRQ
jgi:hypothetical protein